MNQTKAHPECSRSSATPMSKVERKTVPTLDVDLYRLYSFQRVWSPSALLEILGRDQVVSSRRGFELSSSTNGQCTAVFRCCSWSSSLPARQELLPMTMITMQQYTPRLASSKPLPTDYYNRKKPRAKQVSARLQQAQPSRRSAQKECWGNVAKNTCCLRLQTRIRL